MKIIGLITLLYVFRMYKKNEKKIVKYHKNLGRDLLSIGISTRNIVTFLVNGVILLISSLRRLLNGNLKDIPQEEKVSNRRVVNIKDYINEREVNKRKTI